MSSETENKGPEEKGGIADALKELWADIGQKFEVGKITGNKIANTSIEARGNLMEKILEGLKQGWKQLVSVVSMAAMGVLMDSEEFEKYKLERAGIKVTENGIEYSYPEMKGEKGRRGGERKNDNPEVKKDKTSTRLTEEHNQNLAYIQLWPGKNEKDLKDFKEKYEANEALYKDVSDEVDIPPLLIAAIHRMEGGMNFNTYLHNGEKLGKPTKMIPSGILFPEGKNGWRQSAIHALGGNILDNSHPPKPSLTHFRNLKNKFGIHKETNDIGKLAAFAEAYNGYGYRNRGKRSAYVYGGTNLCPQGKYVADGKFDEKKLEERLGVAGLILGMQGRPPIAKEKYLLENSRSIQAMAASQVASNDWQ